MKKIHILSFVFAGFFSFGLYFFANLNPFLISKTGTNILPFNYRDKWNIAPEYLRGLWKFYDKIQDYIAVISLAFLFLLAFSIIIFMISYEPNKTYFLHTSVEMICAIFVVILYLISLGFHGLYSLTKDYWNLIHCAQISTYFLGVLLLLKHLFAKVKLGVFRQSTLVGMLKKSSKKSVGDDVKDLKNKLGINGLDAPWIKPII